MNVTDDGGTTSQIFENPTGACGRGGLIVRELSDDHGWDQDTHGRTTVYFEIHTDTPKR